MLKIFFLCLLPVVFTILLPVDLYGQRKSKGTKELSESDLQTRVSLFMDATKERVLGNYAKAEELYRKVLEIDPNHDASMYELARIYLSDNRPGDAILNIEKAVAIAPENIWYHLLLADIYKRTRQYDKVVEVYEKLIKQYPEKVDYYFDLALSYIIQGDFKGAVGIYDQIESIIGISEEISIQKQKLYLNLDKPEKALEEIKKLVSTDPDNIRYLQILAESYVATGNDREALATYEKIASVDPGNPYIRISLSDYYRKIGDEQKAFEELKAGFSNPSLDLETKIQVLLSFYTIDQFYNEKKNQAFELAEILYKTHPDKPKALSIYGDLLYKAQRLDEAKEVFLKVLQLDNNQYSVWEQLMFIYNEQYKFSDLEKTSEQAIELFPIQPLPYFFNGISNLQTKHYEKAVRSLENGSALVIDNELLLGQFYSSLGDAYNGMKEYKKSDISYDKALQINPNDSYVLNNYSYYLSLRNENLEKARQMANLANQIDTSNASFQDTYGWVLYRLGEYQDAEKWIKKALDNQEKDSAVLLEHYGDVLYKLGRKEEALEYWIKAKANGGETSEFLDKKIRDKKLIE